jgi:uncharacterized protein (DUF4415 family)
MREKSTGTVRFRINPENPPKLSRREAAELRRREADTSDIPSQKGMTWTRPGALIPAENKQQVTLRLDRDVLEFFRKTGKRYQSRMNAVLREYVETNRRTG